jgi:hypothetical protein
MSIVWHNRRKCLQKFEYVSIKSIPVDLQKCINCSRNLGRENRNGIRLVLILEFGQENKTFQ